MAGCMDHLSDCEWVVLNALERLAILVGEPLRARGSGIRRETASSDEIAAASLWWLSIEQERGHRSGKTRESHAGRQADQLTEPPGFKIACEQAGLRAP